jgi:aspartate 1-decarboxylase
MLVELLKAKLHHLRVTQANREYEGSLTLDPVFMEAVGLLPHEKVLVANLENGKRFETYVIKGKRGARVACLNGAAAHCGAIGDRLIVMAWCLLPPEEAQRHKPRVVRLDAHNAIVARAK